MSSSPKESDTFDASRRRLCPDGACVGLLDETGRCKVCGTSASGEPPTEAPFIAFPAADDAEDAAEPLDAAPEPGLEPGLQPREGGFDPKRRLCSDGACLGVLGPNGRCNVCGREG